MTEKISIGEKEYHVGDAYARSIKDKYEKKIEVKELAYGAEIAIFVGKICLGMFTADSARKIADEIERANASEKNN